MFKEFCRKNTTNTIIIKQKNITIFVKFVISIIMNVMVLHHVHVAYSFLSDGGPKKGPLLFDVSISLYFYIVFRMIIMKATITQNYVFRVNVLHSLLIKIYFVDFMIKFNNIFS